MDQNTHVYYLASEFLWFILSAVDYIFENIDAQDLNEQYWAGSAKFDDLAGWLLDEQSVIKEDEKLDLEARKATRRQIEQIVLEWVAVLRTRSQDVNASIRVADTETRLCYFTYGWSLRILSEFDRLLRDLSSIELRQRYQQASAKFEDLAGWLRNELSWVVGRPGVGEEEAKTLQATMESLSEQLAIEWREKVRELAKT